MIEWDSIWKSFSYRRHSINVIRISCQRGRKDRPETMTPVWLGQVRKERKNSISRCRRVSQGLAGHWRSFYFILSGVGNLKSFKKGDDMSDVLKSLLAATHIECFERWQQEKQGYYRFRVSPQFILGCSLMLFLFSGVDLFPNFFQLLFPVYSSKLNTFLLP